MPKVIMSYSYVKTVWQATFFDRDRNRTPLPRKAFFNCEETMVDHQTCR
jgi:hypothetical protein